MVLPKRFLVLANSTKMHPGRCIAGREIIVAENNQCRIGPWVRPITAHGDGEILPHERRYEDGREVAVLDIVEALIDDKVADQYQPENWRLPRIKRWTDVSSRYPRPAKALLEEHPPNLWLQPNVKTDRVDHAYLSAHPPAQSLYMVRPENFRLSLWCQLDGYTKKRRCLFRFKGADYDLCLTDPVLIARYDAEVPAWNRPPLIMRLPCGDDLLLCVSLARALDGWHYKIVATVIEGAK